MQVGHMNNINIPLCDCVYIAICVYYMLMNDQCMCLTRIASYDEHVVRH